MKEKEFISEITRLHMAFIQSLPPCVGLEQWMAELSRVYDSMTAKATDPTKHSDGWMPGDCIEALTADMRKPQREEERHDSLKQKKYTWEKGED